MCRLCLICLLLLSPLSLGQTLRLFAAASLTDALTELSRNYEAKHPGLQVRASFAASSILARQLQQGAHADLFIAADRDWLDFVAHQGLLVDSSRRDLLGNQLVLITPRRQPVHFDSQHPRAFWREFKGHLCLGASTTVPAGKYARASLEYLGWWPLLQAQRVETEDVRAALALVARGECALGIVYQTDAALSAQVQVVSQLPAASHKPIVYPGALLRRHQPEALDFWQFLQAPAAAEVFRRYGFTPLPVETKP